MRHLQTPQGTAWCGAASGGVFFRRGDHESEACQACCEAVAAACNRAGAGPIIYTAERAN